MKLARFSLTAEYTPGKFMVVADTLSRAPISCGEEAVEGINLEVEDFIGGIICNLPVLSNQLQHINGGAAKGLKSKTDYHAGIARVACNYWRAGWTSTVLAC